MKAVKKEVEKQNEQVFVEGSQLKKFNDFEKFMQDAKLFLGDITIQFEARKASAMQQIALQEQKMNELKEEVKAIHGDVIINLETGEVTPNTEK